MPENIEMRHAATQASVMCAAPLARAILRCREPHVSVISARLGIELPQQSCRASSNGPMSALWLGPDEWLILLEDASKEGIPPLAVRLRDVPCSLVDVSHRQVGFSISGPYAENHLARGCPLDLALHRFPTGMCTRTIFAKAEVTLWRTGEDCFHLEVGRSYSNYIETLLGEDEAGDQ